MAQKEAKGPVAERAATNSFLPLWPPGALAGMGTKPIEEFISVQNEFVDK